MTTTADTGGGAAAALQNLREERELLSASAIRALAEDRWSHARPWLDWPLLVVFIVTMTALFAPLGDGRIAIPELDSIATQTIRAERSVVAEDREATELRRTQAATAVRPQFDYDPEALFAKRDQVVAAFAKLVERRDAQAVAIEERRARFEAELGQPVNAVVFGRLEALADPNEGGAALAFFLSDVLDRMVVADRALMPESGAIDVRRRGEAQGTPLYDLNAILDLGEAWRLMRARAAEAPYGEARSVRTWISETALSLVTPNLRRNDVATEALGAAAVDGVEPVTMRISRGEVIVRDGDRVTRQDRAQLAALNDASAARSGWVDSVAFAALLAGLIALGAYFFHRAREPLTFSRKSAYVTLTATLLAGGLSVAAWFAVRAPLDRLGLEPQMAALICPVALGTALVAVLVNSRASLMVGVALALLVTYRADAGIWVAGYHLMGVLVAGIMAQRCRQRIDLLKLGLVVALAQAAASPAVLVLAGTAPNVEYLAALLLALVAGALVAGIALGALPLFEHLFDETTAFRLMELASVGHPTLKKLALHSPGTYHHSVMIANLAEAAADSIGANGLQCRVMALYHDIGKSERPVYFIENQREGNIHDGLPPELSARIIFGHITDGIALARKHRLGRPVIDAITQHQGTTLLRVFHQKALERAAPRGETVSEADYRYPGPKPRTRESGIIMLADSVEAATRALKSPGPADVRARVAKVIAEKLADEQLSDCALRVRDLARVEDAFTRVLVLGVYHNRIEYPPIRAAGERGGHQSVQDGMDGTRQDRAERASRGMAERGS